MRVILLLLPVKAVLAAPSVYVVTDRWGVDWVYKEKREPELHYKRLGQAIWNGEHHFLYTDSRRPQTWILGRGKTLSTAYAEYRAPAREGRPGATHWSWVWDGTKNESGSREGMKEKGHPQPSVRVFGVGMNITGEELVKQLEEEGEEIDTEEYIICNSTWKEEWQRRFISKCPDGQLYCDGVHHCASGSDELCPYVTVQYKSRRLNITREQWYAEGAEDDQGQIACKRPGFRHSPELKDSNGFRDSPWLILDSNDCKRCNKIKDCATGIDELDCPPFVSPSFELPLYCCLVVLVLGVLLHLGWKALNKEVEDEAREIKIIVDVSRRLEEAVDLIVKAAIEDRSFPEASYEILHNHCGGIDLLIGDRHGKSSKYGWTICAGLIFRVNIF